MSKNYEENKIMLDVGTKLLYKNKQYVVDEIINKDNKTVIKLFNPALLTYREDYNIEGTEPAFYEIELTENNKSDFKIL